MKVTKYINMKVNNSIWVLNRITNLIRKRNYNIDDLNLTFDHEWNELDLNYSVDPESNFLIDKTSGYHEIKSIQNSDFIKTEYSEQAWIKVEKKFTDENWGNIKALDIINVNIKLSNISGTDLTNVAFVEKTPRALKIDYSSITMPDWVNIKKWKKWYDFLLDWFDLNANISGEGSYKAIVKPITYWFLDVDPGTWDIIVKPTNKNCWKSVTVFKASTNYSIAKEEQPFCNDWTNWTNNLIKLPEQLENNSIDKNSNWIPDYIDALQLNPEISKHNKDDYWYIGNNKIKEPNWTPDYIDDWIKSGLYKPGVNIVDIDGDWNYDAEDMWGYSNGIFVKGTPNWKADYIEKKENWDIVINPNSESNWYTWSLTDDSDNDWLPDKEDLFSHQKIMETFSDFSVSSFDDIDEWLDEIQEILNWLNCSNSSCFASPLNWAPLSVWSDPVFMWKFIWDKLKTSEWIPILSWLTWVKIWKYCIPWAFPPLYLDDSCWKPWAGWYLGDSSATNFFRIFVSPTLTWWIWMAACFWPKANIVWNIPSKWFSPLIPWWNCIVVADRLTCWDEDFEWDPGSVWIPMTNWNTNIIWNFSVINANCWMGEQKYLKPESSIVNNYLNWNSIDIKPSSFIETFSSDNSLFKQWWAWWWASASVSVDLWAALDWDFSDIIKIEQTRISAFPSWLLS